MVERKRIAGKAGTEPIAKPQSTVEPPPAGERTGNLIEDRGNLYVQSGTLKIRLDNASVAMLQRVRSDVRKSGKRAELTVPDALKPAIESARKYRDMLLRRPDVIAVRAGYKFVKGEITQTPCVVVAVNRKRTDVVGDDRVPPVLPGGVPTDVTVADPYERLVARRDTEAVPVFRRARLLIDEIQGDATEAELEEALPVISYEPPEDGNLDPVSGPMTLICHVSPDAGWRVLRPFLEATERKLCLGMYDFTAPHIYRTARSLLRDSGVSWRQTLGPKESLPGEDDVDSTKAEDLSEKDVIRGLQRVAEDRFESAFAQVGSGRTFASAYHIKVAVRDDSAIWLSSGNWQSSNQPDTDFLDVNADRQLLARYNREWHVVVENPTLAKRFQCFLEYDFETASTAEVAVEERVEGLPDLIVSVDELLEEERRAADLEVFPPQKFVFTQSNPLTVRPILTPDNYLEVVLDFLRKKPSRRLYFQNQSLNPVKDPSPEFDEMMRLLAEYSNVQDLDVRIIFRNIGPVRKKLESLQLAGFNMGRVRMQSGCHTKGIIIDSEVVLLGSHNFTNQGVQVNRDASILIRHEGIAKYYEHVFLHDWAKLARATIREEATPIPVVSGREEAELLTGSVGIARVPWSYYEEE